MLLHDFILARAQEMPAKIALRRGDDAVDFEMLADAVRQAAGGFVALGVRPGDRIGIYVNKRIEAVVSYFGAGYSGGVFVPINVSLKPAQVAHILRDCDVTMLVTTAAQAELLAAITEREPTHG